jgi:hypothetical protein
MSMKSKLAMAAAAITLAAVAAGCATQGATNPTAACPTPMAQPAASCKGMSSCKGKANCKGKKVRKHCATK